MLSVLLVVLRVHCFYNRLFGCCSMVPDHSILGSLKSSRLFARLNARLSLTIYSWFSVTMGTGIVSILFYFMPYNARWLHYLSIIFFCLNAALFTAAFVVSFLRYTLYPEIWSVMIRDPNNSLFLGTIPMGFATLIEMWVFICVPVWGAWATTLAWVLWMIDTIVAAGVTLSLSVLLWVSSVFSSNYGRSDQRTG